MPNRSVKFSRKLITDIKAEDKEYTLADTGSPLRLRVMPSGTQTYRVVKKVNGKVKKVTIGNAYEVPLEKARAKAVEIVSQLALGQYEGKSATKGFSTFSELTNLYMDSYAKGHKTSSIRSERNGVNNACELLAKLPINEIKRSHARALKNMMADNPASLFHAFGAARRVLDMALEDELIDVNPFDSRKLAPKAVKARSRVLTKDEWAKIYLAATELGGSSEFVRFLALAPLRISEVVNLEWSMVDIENARVVLPGTMTKNAEDHICPIPALAVEVLQQQRAGHHKQLVFPSKVTGHEIKGLSKIKARIDQVSGVTDWRFHDFRRTIVSLCASEAPLISPEALDKWLNHAAASTSGGVKGVYQRSTMMKAIEVAAGVWGAIVNEALGEPESNIVLLGHLK